MKPIFAAIVLTVAASAVFAQTSSTNAQPSKAPAKTSAQVPVKAAAKPAAKAAPKARTAKKPVSKTTGKAAAAVAAPAVAVAGPTRDLSPEELAIAKTVYTGTINCDLGVSVIVRADEKTPGYFFVETKGAAYHMAPVHSVTGAVRLEDPASGGLWLQVATKSMLMNEKEGLRQADNCQVTQQIEMAETVRKNPPPDIFAAPQATAGASK